MSRTVVPAAILALVLAVIPALASTPSAANAADEITWGVEPVPDSTGARTAFTYQVDPGVQITDSVVISNVGATAAEFNLYATDAINVPETGAFGLLESGIEATDVGAWITLADESITLEPGTEATVPFSLVVPSDASPGEHIAGIVASVISESENDEGNAVTLEQRVGARVYLNVSGTEIADVEVAGLTSSFAASLNPFSGGDLSLSFDLRNTGNQRLDVTPVVTVAGPFGIPLAEVPMDPLQELLPRQTVRLSTELPAIAALALLWSTVTVTPSPVGSSADSTEEADETGATPSPTATPSETPMPVPTGTVTPDPATTTGADQVVQDVVVTDEELSFEPVSETTMGFAISWTMLAIIVGAVLLIFLIWRYITATRERMYLAIDEATESARQEALTSGREEGK